MFCQKCGTENGQEAKFCKNCGVAVTNSNGTGPQTEKFKDGQIIKCSNCGFEGPGKRGRRLVSQILAWLALPLFWPATLIYFIVTRKYKCPNCGSGSLSIKNRYGIFKDQSSKTNPVIWVFVVFVGIAFLGIISSVILATLSTARERASEANQINDQSTSIASSSLEKIKKSVVNILCPSALSNEEVSGGSGTIISNEGLILTNSHIIPQDEESLHTTEAGCLVVLPNPDSGQPLGVYLAKPIVLAGSSDKYDLAFMQIYDAYFDEEKGEYAGVYPQEFPSFDDTSSCAEENVQLSEPIRIFGYPAISGGYSLTVTDGIVSSFPGEGLIVTSAKISHGNSGGLAVDRNGCMIGIPSLVSTDEYESLGVIISTDLIASFVDEAEKQLR